MFLSERDKIILKSFRSLEYCEVDEKAMICKFRYHSK